MKITHIFTLLVAIFAAQTVDIFAGDAWSKFPEAKRIFDSSSAIAKKGFFVKNHRDPQVVSMAEKILNKPAGTGVTGPNGLLRAVDIVMEPYDPLETTNPALHKEIEDIVVNAREILEKFAGKNEANDVFREEAWSKFPEAKQIFDSSSATAKKGFFMKNHSDPQVVLIAEKILNKRAGSLMVGANGLMVASQNALKPYESLETTRPTLYKAIEEIVVNARELLWKLVRRN